MGEPFEPTRTSIATGRGNIFRPSYALGIPRYFFDSRLPANKRSEVQPANPPVVLYSPEEDKVSFMKRSAALGRSRFRPGKRSMITMEELEDMGTPVTFVLSAPLKRSMAVGRFGFRPGKRSIATGRAGFRPGKRSSSEGELDIGNWEDESY
uniref:Uncharacterized protein n=1 Tax=Ditylenchus dipsaci TaxID=166011 RepID=A0A915DP59_9BILA